MLQPSQIQSVSQRLGNEIVEVRGFLRQAGISPDGEFALREVVRRIAADPGFHRDLGSHVWMLLYAGVSVPDVMGVLAIAAAGPADASRADETAAHALLRFVMESRRALDTPAIPATPEVTGPQSTPTPAASTLPTQPIHSIAETPAEGAAPRPGPVPVPERPRAVPPIAEPPAAPLAAGYQQGRLRAITPPIVMASPQDPDAEAPLHARPADAGVAPARRSGLALVAALIVAALLAAGWWILRGRTSTAPANANGPAPVVDGTSSAPQPAAPVDALANSAGNRGGSGYVADNTTTGSTGYRNNDTAALPTRRPPLARPSAYAAHPSAAAPFHATSPNPASAQPVYRSAAPTASISSASAPSTAVAAPVVRSSSAPAVMSTGAPRPLISSGIVPNKPASPPVPSNVLSGRLGSPAFTASDADDDRVAGTRGYPRLLRRKALDSGGTLLAKNTPSVTFTSTPLPAGTVRSTALGISAGSLVYAPEPVYPAAAASQRISGQVRLEAMVDREGNVASARVISGPPMLRDAAVNAVQQWRYRPLKAGGKPQTFTATTVVDFQLQ